MDYVTGVDDVTRFIPSLPTLSGSTTPTDVEVEAIIEQWEATLNGVLRAAGYSTPLTATDDVRTCLLMVSQISAVDTFIAAYAFDELPDQYKRFQERWDKFVSMIKKGELEFSSDTPASADFPAFGIVRSPTRDDLFTNRYRRTDWDE